LRYKQINGEKGMALLLAGTSLRWPP
jgi:hypothetical protein